MALAEASEGNETMHRQTNGVTELLVPFFLVNIGMQLRLDVFRDPSIILLSVVVTLVAVATKFFACGAAAWGLGRRRAAQVGMGMVPRGEVGVVVAQIGLALAVIGPELYGVVLFMAVATTLVAPPFIKLLYASEEQSNDRRGRRRRGRRAARHRLSLRATRPSGWQNNSAASRVQTTPDAFSLPPPAANFYNLFTLSIRRIGHNERLMKKLLLALAVAALYVLHQDVWNWRVARPFVFGAVPFGLFYHACFAVAASLVMWLLVKFAWPSHLEQEVEGQASADERSAR